MKGAKGSQDHFRAQEGGHTNQHPPHMKGAKDHFRAQEGGHTIQHRGGKENESMLRKGKERPEKETPQKKKS